MADWSFLRKEFDKYGINEFQYRNAVIPLDKVFGLDESRHCDGLHPYGVSSLSLFDRGVSIDYYKGDICSKFVVCSRGRFYECGSKNKRLLTENEEEGVYDYCIGLINLKKERIEKNKYWVEHFNDFLNDCLCHAKKYLEDKKLNGEYYVELSRGNSLADKSVADALVIRYKCDNSQKGYIKIFQDRFGDISFDGCSLGCHTEYDIKDPSNVKGEVYSVCAWCL